jgi:hypothetical protein
MLASLRDAPRFFAFPVVSLADSLNHRLQLCYPFGISEKERIFQNPSSRVEVSDSVVLSQGAAEPESKDLRGGSGRHERCRKRVVVKVRREGLRLKEAVPAAVISGKGGRVLRLRPD